MPEVAERSAVACFRAQCRNIDYRPKSDDHVVQDLEDEMAPVQALIFCHILVVLGRRILLGNDFD